MQNTLQCAPRFQFKCDYGLKVFQILIEVQTFQLKNANFRSTTNATSLLLLLGNTFDDTFTCITLCRPNQTYITYLHLYMLIQY